MLKSFLFLILLASTVVSARANEVDPRYLYSDTSPTESFDTWLENPPGLGSELFATRIYVGGKGGDISGLWTGEAVYLDGSLLPQTEFGNGAGLSFADAHLSPGYHMLDFEVDFMPNSYGGWLQDLEINSVPDGLCTGTVMLVLFGALAVAKEKQFKV